MAVGKAGEPADRERGYGVSMGGYETGISTIAAPVFNEQGRVACAISISVPSQRIEDEARAQLQALDDKRALRRSGVKSVHDIGDDDWDEEDVDDEDGPEIIYVRD